MTTSGFHFILYDDLINYSFFKHNYTPLNYDFNNLSVYINGELTDQAANKISAINGDEIQIISNNDVYPIFTNNLSDVIDSILEPFPRMIDVDGSDVTDLSYCFCNNFNLRSIPTGLFDNNPNIVNFEGCFENCTSLQSIPSGLFDKQVNATSFRCCFNGCKSLKQVPLDLFDKNKKAEDFVFCFSSCYSLNLKVQIGSESNTVAADLFNWSVHDGIVYCKPNTAAYKEFANNDTTYVKVFPY